MKLMLNGKEVTGMGHYVMAGDIKDATAEDSNVLSGKSYYNNNGKREGTMPNRGGMSAELAAGGSVGIPEGYHDGTGSVRAQDLASQTAGTAAAVNIEAGYTAWVNGVMVEGTLNPGIGPFQVLSTKDYYTVGTDSRPCIHTIQSADTKLFELIVEGSSLPRALFDRKGLAIRAWDYFGRTTTATINGNTITFVCSGPFSTVDITVNEITW